MKIFESILSRIFSVHFLFAMLALITLYSCEIIDPEPPEPPPPDCEVYETGNVTVKNRTGYGGYVDCTRNSNTTYDERWVGNGSSTKYRNVDANETKRVWFSLDKDSWIYDTEFLSPCEHLEFTWTNSGKKSTGEQKSFFIEVKSMKTGQILDVCEVQRWVQKE